MTNNMPSRRDFLETSTSVAAGLALAGGLNIARSAHAAGGEEIKVALIGCGGRGTGAASQALLTEGPVKLWAMADLSAEKLETSRKNLAAGCEASYDRAQVKGFGDRVDVPPERRFVGFDA